MKNEMKGMAEIEELFKAKELFHKELAEISFEKKIEILVKLQEIANVMRSLAGKRKKTVWKI